MSSKRIEWLDIAKGIGIFLVVYAHARAPYNSYIYNFHMPLFFLISGILYKSGRDLKSYIFRKIQTLYIPFVSWNLIFIIGKSILRHQEISVDYIIEVILTLQKDGEFLGATWFLGALFLITVIYKLLDYYISDMPSKRWILLGVFAAWGIIGFEITLPYMLSRTFILGFFYAIGNFGKEFFLDLKLNKTTIVYMVIAAGTFFVIGHYNSANMGANEYKYRILFVIGALAASYVTLCFSKIVGDMGRKYIFSLFRKGICLMGKKSVDIVIWQFVAFRIVIAIQLCLNGISLTKLLDYYPMYSERNGWWIAYTLAGIVIPIVWGIFLRGGIWGKVLRKIHVVN